MAGHALTVVMAELSLCTVQHQVLGCFRERTYMLTMNPHITNWVPIAVPPPGERWVPDGSTYAFQDAAENSEALLAVVMKSARGRREMHTRGTNRFSGVFAPSRCRSAHDRLDKWIIWPPPFEACLNYASAAGESRLQAVHTLLFQQGACNPKEAPSFCCDWR